eukprot:c8427_g1_i1.p1 GENE.c8427_g1_i1~~c8427_g1_i1.p1  ORF type:complete len:324 (-),score=89.38 c8427_g1_i1:126-1097(-)
MGDETSFSSGNEHPSPGGHCCCRQGVNMDKKRSTKPTYRPAPNALTEERRVVEEDNNAEDVESDEESDDSGITHSEEDVSWISWFCSLKGNEFFVEVDDDYIRDDFNLTGLTSQVPYYDYALDLILDIDPPPGDSLTEEQQEMIESAAEMLYGLIHARYILTTRGMAAMREKYCSADFGRCPRVLCYGFPVIPVGQSDIPCSNTVKIYCSKCEDIYYPKSSRHTGIDGAYFGTSFPHLFLQTYAELRGAEPTQRYVPRIFGFRLHKPEKPRSISDGRDAAVESSQQQQQQQQQRKPSEPKPAPALFNDGDDSSSDPPNKDQEV